MLMLNIIIFSFSVLTIQGSFNSGIIRSFFYAKKIKIASVLACFHSKHDQLLRTKQFLQENVMISFKNFANPGNEELLQNLFIKHGYLGVIIDSDCPFFQEFIIQASKRNLFNSNHHWLILSNTSSSLDSFQSAELFIDASINVVVFEEESLGDEGVTILDVYNPGYGKGGQLVTTPVGVYNTSGWYYSDFNAINKYWSRKDMTNVYMKGAFLSRTPFNGTLEDYLEPIHFKYERYSRFHSRLVFSCRDYHNFTLDTVWMTSWGYKRNGTWDGIVGALSRRLVDISMTGLFMFEDRFPVVTYGRKTIELTSSFMFRNPRAITSFRAVLDPLSTTVWTATCVTALLAILTLKKMANFEMRKTRSEVESKWSGLLLFTIGALCQQGATNTPNLSSGRIVVLSIFILALVIYQFYSAVIVSNLLMQSGTNIKSIEDLVKYPIGVGSQDNIFLRYYFQNATDEWVRQLYERKIHRGGALRPSGENFFSLEAGLELVRRGGFAFHVEADNAYPVIALTFADTAVCELRQVKMLSAQDIFAVYQKDTHYRDLFDTCLHCLAERGILAREVTVWRSRKPECLQVSSVQVVTLDEFYPALLFVAGGLVLSLALLLAELATHHGRHLLYVCMHLAGAPRLGRLFRRLIQYGKPGGKEVPKFFPRSG